MQASGRCVIGRDPVKKLAQYIKENEEDLDPEEIYKLAYNLAESGPTEIAKSSRLKLLRKELRKLGADSLTIEATYVPDIIYASNKKQRELCEDKGFDCPDFFTLEKVQERLQKCDISNPPSMQNLIDIMIMLCMRPADVKGLCINRITQTDTTLTILGTALDMLKIKIMNLDHFFLWKKIRYGLENYLSGSKRLYKKDFHFC